MFEMVIIYVSSGMIAMVSTYDHHFALRFSSVQECPPKQEILPIPVLRNFIVCDLFLIVLFSVNR
jgi:hypothetical protein